MGISEYISIWLVVYLPLWKMMELKSVGMMTFPTEWNNKSHVPDHQPAIMISDTYNWEGAHCINQNKG